MIALVGGAVINVAVAWSFSVWSGRSDLIGNWNRKDERPRPAPCTPDLGVVGGPVYTYTFTRLWLYETSGTSMEMGYLDGSTSADQRARFHQYLVCWRSGWPARSLTAFGVYSNLDNGPLVAEAGLPIPTRFAKTPRDIVHGDWLPIRPLVLGFALDTAIFALPVLLVILMPGVVRRQFRRRAGLCTACRYDRRGLLTSSPCPECGLVPT